MSLYSCDSRECTADAVTVLRFRDQPGHVHDCGPCSAILRENADVIWSAPLGEVEKCPLPHNEGKTWVDKPRGIPEATS